MIKALGKQVVRGFLPALFVGLSVLLVGPQEAAAVLNVDVTRGNVEPLPIAVPDTAPASEATTSVGSLADIGINIGG